MRKYLLLLSGALLFCTSVARADTFSYSFSGVFDDQFTYVSSVLFTSDAQFVADTCTIAGVSRTCTVSLVLSNQALGIDYPIGGQTAGIAHDSLGPNFFTLGTHTVREDTITIADIPGAVSPEPSSLFLLGTAIAGVFGASRRRRTVCESATRTAPQGLTIRVRGRARPQP